MTCRLYSLFVFLFFFLSSLTSLKWYTASSVDVHESLVYVDEASSARRKEQPSLISRKLDEDDESTLLCTLLFVRVPVFANK